jgi:hypothetical protein
MPVSTVLSIWMILSAALCVQPGSTMVVKANSVKHLQDILPDQLAGLLDLGVSVGNWPKVR